MPERWAVAIRMLKHSCEIQGQATLDLYASGGAGKENGWQKRDGVRRGR